MQAFANEQNLLEGLFKSVGRDENLFINQICLFEGYMSYITHSHMKMSCGILPCVDE